MADIMVNTTCCLCGTPRRVRRRSVHVRLHCGTCARGIAARNRRKATGTGSQYKGVTYIHDTAKGYNPGRPWMARIKTSGKTINLGVLANEEWAAEAYDREAVRLWGDQARTNFRRILD